MSVLPRFTKPRLVGSKAAVLRSHNCEFTARAHLSLFHDVVSVELAVFLLISDSFPPIGHFKPVRIFRLDWSLRPPRGILALRAAYPLALASCPLEHTTFGACPQSAAENRVKIHEVLGSVHRWLMSLPSVGRPAYALLQDDKDCAMDPAASTAECRICQGADSGEGTRCSSYVCGGGLRRSN